MSALVEAKGLTKHFRLDARRKVHAVDQVSLAIAPREILGLVGESGSGKSTFGRALLGLHQKTAGEVFFKGERLPDRYGPSEFRHWSSKLQMIFQDPYSSLNPRMTIGEIVAEGLKLRGDTTPAERSERVALWLKRVGLDPGHASRYPHEFSGGQRQRVGIARALILEPEFVVCDEPISALDVSVQAQVVRLLGELKEAMGLTLLFIAHDLSMVRYISDRMAVMYMGTIVEIGPADEVYFEPQHPYTQALIAANPTPDPRGEREKPTQAIGGEIMSPVNVGPGCRFAARCPHVMARCRTETPELAAIDPAAGAGGRQVACHLFDEGTTSRR